MVCLCTQFDKIGRPACIRMANGTVAAKELFTQNTLVRSTNVRDRRLREDASVIDGRAVRNGSASEFESDDSALLCVPAVFSHWHAAYPGHDCHVLLVV